MNCFFGRINLVNTETNSMVSATEPCMRPVVTVVIDARGKDYAYVCKLHHALLLEQGIAERLRRRDPER